MKATCLLTGLFILAAAIAGSVRGAVFTVDLAPSVQTGPDGEYLSAAFDLGIEFDAIQSVVLEFVMPAGYEATFVTTGNSSYSQFLGLTLHETRSQPHDQLGSVQGISTNFGGVLANELMQVPIFNLILYTMTEDANFVPPALKWPSFLYDGKGQVSMYAISNSSFHPLPTGATVSSSPSWSLPPAVENMRLIVAGNAVPEPSCVMLTTLFVAAATLRREW